MAVFHPSLVTTDPILSRWWTLVSSQFSQDEEDEINVPIALSAFRDTISQDVVLAGVYVPCIYRMPGGVVVGDSGLCCSGPVRCVTSVVRAQLLPIVC